jgi:hypothetical protein
MRIHTRHSLIYACTLLGAAPPTRRTHSLWQKKAHNGIIVSLRCLFSLSCSLSGRSKRAWILLYCYIKAAARPAQHISQYAMHAESEMHARHNTKRNNSRRVIFNEPDQIINQLALSSERRGINAAREYIKRCTLSRAILSHYAMCATGQTHKTQLSQFKRNARLHKVECNE